jgi:hypothetical protein
MKTRSFYDLDQAFSYLTNSVIRVGGKAVMVTGVLPGDQGHVLNFYRLDDGRKKNDYILHNAPEVDMEPVPLGLLSIDDKSSYTDTVMCSRSPRRLWKVGLTYETLCTNVVHEERHNYTPSINVLQSKELGRTIEGSYPVYAAAKELVGKKNRLVAFSRRFAVDKDDLYYQTYQVPVGMAEKDRPSLLPEFDFLQQVLEEDFHA